MPLPTPQLVTLPLIGGLDESIDPKALEAPRFRDLRNVLISKTGLVEKRLGFQPMSGSVNEVGATSTVTPPTISNCHTLNNFGGTLGLIGRSATTSAFARRLYTWNGTLSAWDEKYYVPEATAEVRGVAANYTTFTEMDVAYVNGFLVYAYITDRFGTNGVYATAVNAATGEVVFADKQVYYANGVPALYVRVLGLGNTAVVVYTTGANILAGTMTMLGGAIPLRVFAPVTLATDRSTDATMDASEIWPTSGATPSTFIIAYRDTMNRIALRTFTSAGAAITSTTKVPASNPLSFAVHGSTSGGAETEITWVAYQETTANNVRTIGVRQDTLATTVADAIVYAATGLLTRRLFIVRHTATAAYLVVSEASARGMRVFYFDTGGVLSPTAGHTMHWVQACSKPIVVGTRLYVMANLSLGSTNSQGTYYLLEVSHLGGTSLVDASGVPANSRAVATVLPRQASDVWDLILRPKLVQISAGLIHCTVPAAVDGQRTGLYGVTFDFSVSRGAVAKGHANRMYQNVSSGTHHTMTGGAPMTFDGAAATESSFLYYPTYTATTSNTGGAALINGATYGVAVIYEYVDAAGHVHRSAPLKAAVAITSGGHNAIDLAVATLQLTYRYQSQAPATLAETVRTVQAVAYLTEANGSIFYRHTAVKMLPSSETVTINLTTTPVTTGEQLYDTGGEQHNLCPPSATCATLSSNCVWLAGCDDPGRVWVSKPITPAEGVAFNDDRVIFMPDKIYGIQAMDGAVYCFGTDAVYVLDGDPPDATGAGGSLREPYQLTTEHGCIDARSIVLAPAGIYFQSRSGLCLLNRSRQIVRLSEVEDQLTSRPFVSSALVFPKFGQVRWTIGAVEPQAGVFGNRILIHDYTNNVWHYSEFEDVGYNIRAQAVVGDTYYAGDWNGLTIEEQLADWTDEGIWVTMACELGEVHLAGMAGFQRVWRATLLANKYTDADLTMSVYSDYATSPSQTATFDGYVAFASGKIEPQLYVKQQRCESIRIKWSDAAPSNPSGVGGNGRGYSFSAVALEVGVEPGTNRGRSAHRK